MTPYEQINASCKQIIAVRAKHGLNGEKLTALAISVILTHAVVNSMSWPDEMWEVAHEKYVGDTGVVEVHFKTSNPQLSVVAFVRAKNEEGSTYKIECLAHQCDIDIYDMSAVGSFAAKIGEQIRKNLMEIAFGLG